MVSRPALVLGALWVTGAVVATSVGLVAVRQVGNEVGGEVSSPLSGEAVRQALTSVPPATDRREAPEPSESAEVEGAVRTVTTAAGVLSGRCRDDVPALLYATPADGYRTERDAATAVRFVGLRDQVVVQLACRDEQLLAAVTTTVLGRTPAPTPAPARTQAPAPHETAGPDRSEAPEPAGSDGTEQDH